jgi:hypothetical protein
LTEGGVVEQEWVEEETLQEEEEWCEGVSSYSTLIENEEKNK